jgi:hypothetical protein
MHENSEKSENKRAQRHRNTCAHPLGREITERARDACALYCKKPVEELSLRLHDAVRPNLP